MKEIKEILEEMAVELGFRADNYYSAADYMKFDDWRSRH